MNEAWFGDRFTILVGNAAGRREGTMLVTREMPSALNLERPLPTERNALTAARKSLVSAANALFDTSSTGSTDLLTSLRTAADYFSAAQDDHDVLVLLSDMLHCVPNELCMDRSQFVEVPAAWFDQARQNGVLPRLSAVCVSVIGAEQATARDRHVREFWTRYFEMAGARLSRYTYSPVWMSSDHCEERGT